MRILIFIPCLMGAADMPGRMSYRLESYLLHRIGYQSPVACLNIHKRGRYRRQYDVKRIYMCLVRYCFSWKLKDKTVPEYAACVCYSSLLDRLVCLTEWCVVMMIIIAICFQIVRNRPVFQLEIMLQSLNLEVGCFQNVSISCSLLTLCEITDVIMAFSAVICALFNER